MIATLALIVAACAALPAAGPVAAPVPATPPASIVVIMTDDLDEVTVTAMPRLRSLLHDRGTTFNAFFAAVPICCPNRASLMRGQYGHNHQVTGNYRWYEGLYLSGREEDTLATRLDPSHRVIGVGKYMNAYPGDAAPTYVPPGWNRVRFSSGEPEYLGYRLIETSGAGPPSLVDYGSAAEHYSTDVFAQQADHLIRETAADGEPFFLYVAPKAPHGPQGDASVAPRHRGAAVTQSQRPRSLAFDEADVSDKPSFVRGLPRLTQKAISDLDQKHRQRQRQMLAVEDLVQTILTALSETGRLESTYLFFTSDNGVHFGEHRMTQDSIGATKGRLYDTDIKVPLVVRGPGVPEGATRDQLVSMIDLLPTILDITGLSAPDYVDGRSFRTLLQPVPERWPRRGLLVQTWNGADNDESGRGPHGRALVTASRRYLEHHGLTPREYELYRSETDPEQIENVYASASRAEREELQRALDALKDCTGASCRAAEDAAPD